MSPSGMPENSAPITIEEALLFFRKWAEEKAPLWMLLSSSRFCEMTAPCSILSVDDGLIQIRIFTTGDLSFRLEDAIALTFGSSEDSARSFILVSFDGEGVHAIGFSDILS